MYSKFKLKNFLQGDFVVLKKCVALCSIAATLGSFAGVDDLQGEFRNGQLFLRWKENDLPASSRLSVWSSPSPITRENLSGARKIAGMLNVNSARDWHLDIDSFVVNRSKKLKSEEIFAGDVADTGKNKVQINRGFIIRDNGKPISPESGLHVHTPKKDETGKRYYAVTVHKGSLPEIISFTATGKPIEVGPGKARPIVISGKWPENCAKGLPLLISLHGRGGGVAVSKSGKPQGSHLFFADSTLAWREGIPFKFQLIKQKDFLEIRLFDRVWIGRIMSSAEASDARDLVPAISTFWCGYNPDIANKISGPEYRFDNYTERYIIHIIRWAQEYLGTDVNRTYITGGSMGGSGTVQMITRYPEVFAAGAAFVPIYSYTWRKPAAGGGTSAWRLTCSTGKFTAANPARMPDGTDVTVFTDGSRNINRPAVDIPPMIAVSSRTPICQSSTLELNSEDNYLTNSLKSTLPSALNWITIIFPSKDL